MHIEAFGGSGQSKTFVGVPGATQLRSQYSVMFANAKGGTLPVRLLPCRDRNTSEVSLSSSPGIEPLS